MRRRYKGSERINDRLSVKAESDPGGNKMMNEIGRLCVKLAGRDSNKTCVIVDVLDEHTVLIDGQTRRRKCNIRHLEPLNKVIKLSKGASHADVKKAFAELNLEVTDTKPKNAEQRPKKAKALKAVAEPDKKKDRKDKKEKEKKEKASKKAAEKKAKSEEAKVSKEK
jgi:large subunit ribosomal protein L14e